MSKIKRAYIGGAVTGWDSDVVLEKFARKEQELLAQGYSIYNPVTLVQQHPELKHCDDWHKIMRYLVPFLMASDELHLLPCWRDSKGAIKERQHAREYRIKIVYP